MIRRHDYAFDPSLLPLDNAAEDFWQDYRRKQGLPPDSVSESDLIKAEVELFEIMSQQSGLSPADCRESLKHGLAELPCRHCHKTGCQGTCLINIMAAADEAAEKQFIQDVERMRAAKPEKRFDWKVLGMFLLAFVLAVICAYLGLNGGEW